MKLLQLSGMFNDLILYFQVLCLINGMPKLQFLNLCTNALENDSWPQAPSVGAFSQLEHLILNNTGVSWDVTHNLLKLCPM